ncbi:hypothetical protein L1987_74419 [Smallanthus sonchifolius]|uniref:Uncharacterized protein n=1 Tax=Smallanthus sonchifolius TaxID=185202 RepID=A0ACB9A1W9_9ASTR|nr:hypothetical protein L1987_74419 [Smallanthus sonchifolius]
MLADQHVDTEDIDHHTPSKNINGNTTDIYLTGEGSNTAEVFVSPNGSRHWIPIVPVEYLPVLATTFEKWEDAVNMYEKYTEIAGFSIRLGAMKKRAR